MRFLLRFSRTRSVGSMHHEVAKFVGSVESRARRDTLVVAEDNDRMIFVPDGEAIDV